MERFCALSVESKSNIETNIKVKHERCQNIQSFWTKRTRTQFHTCWIITSMLLLRPERKGIETLWMKRLWIEKVNLWHFWSLAGALLIALASWYPINPTATSLHISYCLPLFDSYCNMSSFRASHLYTAGCPWKDLAKCSSDAWPLCQEDPPVKSLEEIKFLADFPIVIKCK